MKIFIIESSEIKLVSLNQAFATLRNGRRVKSKQSSEFAKKIDILMRARRFDFEAFESHFNTKTNVIIAKLELGVSGLYTKDGRISKTSGDIANYEKVLLDCVLTGIIDDAYIVQWEMCKLDAKIPYFKLTLEIVDR